MTILFKDTFTGTNGTLLTAHTPDIGTASWVNVTGAGVSINGNQAASSDGNHTIGAVDVGTADCIISTLWVVVPEYQCRNMFRISDNNNYFRLDREGTTFRLLKLVSGSFTSLAVVSFGSTAVFSQPVKITLNGSQIKVDIGSTNYITITETFNQTETKHGISPGDATVRFDDFQIDSLATGGTDATITAIAATATSSAIAPTVTAQRNATITSVIASSVASGVAPTVSAQKQVAITSVIANATASAIAPVVGAVTSVNSVAASANAQAIPPTITAQKQVAISAVVANSNAAAMAPTVSIVQPNVTIQSVIASAVARALNPTVLLNFSAIVRRVSISGSGEHASIHGEPSNMKRTALFGEAPASPQTKRTIIGGEV